MRTIFSIIAFFSLCTLHAQAPEPSFGRELPRSRMVAYPTQQEATAADGGDNRYYTRIAEWSRSGNTLSAPFTVPFAWANRQVLFHLASASAPYEVRVNGRTVARNNDPSLPADFNLTRHTHEGRNTLEIVLAEPSPLAPLESWKSGEAAPAVGTAYVMSQPTMRIRDVLVKTWQSDTTTMAEVGIVVKSEALNPRTSRFHYQLLTPTGEIAATGYKDVTLDMRREDTVRFIASIPTHLRWSAELPTQYTLRLRTQHEGRYAEYMELRPGFRTLEMHEGRPCINGQPVTLRIREVPGSISENELAQLREQGINTLLLQPGTVPETFYEVCDRMGMYVIAQAPIDTRSAGTSRRIGGNPGNDPAWQAAFIERTEDSFHTSKRHPSVIAFSLARESANGINLYESYLNLKRKGDTRPVIYPEAAGEWNSDRLEPIAVRP